MNVEAIDFEVAELRARLPDVERVVNAAQGKADAAAHQARVPRLHAVGFESATQRIEFERLILPLSSDGGHIDKFMSVNEHLKKFSRELEEELEEKAVIRFSAA